MNVEVRKYRKPDGYATRYWAVLVDGELLAVTLYRKGAEAVARAITNPNPYPHATILEDSVRPSPMPGNPAAGVATYRPR
jgi:hypothetical protein